MDNCILELKDLKKYYGKIRGIEDVSLKLHEGEIFGFIGPNGAGKSTTIRSIMGLINITDGKILINGKELAHNNCRKLYRWFSIRIYCKCSRCL